MHNENCDDRKWFYIDNRRAMVSLGPLSSNKTCPYSCAFCYVQDGFVSYEKKEIDVIIDFLVRYRDEYDIIYVSGDTDSFAKPRKKQGLSLLKGIAEKIDVDLLFTTRTIFKEEDIALLKDIVEMLDNKGHKLYACISVTRYSDDVSYLEPYPIPTPNERLNTLKQLHQIGAVTVLALRPFIPVVDIDDYLTILRLVEGSVDIVLGEAFYFQEGGEIQRRVFPNGLPEDIKKNLRKEKMDFNKNQDEWLVWNDEYTESVLRRYCREHNITFSMRSALAIQEYRKKNMACI